MPERDGKRLSSERVLSLFLVFFVFLTGFSKWRIDQSFEWRFAFANELVMSNHYLEDLGTLFAGSHRIAADAAYVQFLQYYGTPEGEHRHDHGDSPFHDFTSEGIYARLTEFGTRIMRLDPFFRGAILEVAGALAFNQRRTHEALGLLKEAIKRDPSYFRYHLYVSAILYKEKGDELNLMLALEEASKTPDCPILLLRVLGNLFKKQGHYGKAAQMYVRIIGSARSHKDRMEGERRLQLLVKEHPPVLKEVEALFKDNQALFN